MNITELRPGMHVKDYDDYEFVVASVSEPFEDKWGLQIQVNTQCGNTVDYFREHWDSFTLCQAA